MSREEVTVEPQRNKANQAAHNIRQWITDNGSAQSDQNLCYMLSLDR